MIGFEPLKGSHTGEYMAGVLYKVLEHFSITKRLLCIKTDNAGNNRTMRKELEELLNSLDVNNNWSSDSTKIPCLAHVIQLVIKKRQYSDPGGRNSHGGHLSKHIRKNTKILLKSQKS